MSDPFPRIHILQHVSFEGPGFIADWILRHQHGHTCCCLSAGDQLPEIYTFDWLIIMGGPMGIYDETDYPWLKAEKQFIRKAIDNNKILIGFCLGAQLLSDALGARVHSEQQPEIGWYPVFQTDEGFSDPWIQNFPSGKYFFHWHSDQFAIPRGAVHLFRSEACLSQGFRYGNHIFAFQFHPEITPTGLESLLSHCPIEADQTRPFIQTVAEINQLKNHHTDGNDFLAGLLESLLHR